MISPSFPLTISPPVSRNTATRPCAVSSTPMYFNAIGGGGGGPCGTGAATGGGGGTKIRPVLAGAGGAGGGAFGLNWNGFRADGSSSDSVGFSSSSFTSATGIAVVAAGALARAGLDGAARLPAGGSPPRAIPTTTSAIPTAASQRSSRHNVTLLAHRLSP